MTIKHLLSLMVLISSLSFIKSMEELAEPIQETNIQKQIYDSRREKVARYEETSNSVEIYDNHTKNVLCKLEGHSAPITCVAWHPDNSKNLIVTGSDDTTIKLWSSCTGECLSTFRISDRFNQYKSSITSIAFNNDNICIAGNAAGLALLLNFSNVTTEKPYLILSYEQYPIQQTLFNESGTIACIVSNTKITIFIKDLSGSWLNNRRSFDLPSTKRVESIKLGDNNIIFIRINDIETNELNCITLRIVNNRAFELDMKIFDYCEQTKKALTLNNQNNLIEYSFDAEQLSNPLFTPPIPIKSAAYHQGGNRIIIRTEQEFFVLEKNEDKWLTIFYQAIPSQPEFNAERNQAVTTSSSQEEMESTQAENNIMDTENIEQPI